ncbi:agmatine deiminase family protein [Methylocucumis oryzae]|uniref:agmatine deiminase family protein n=1 Tax=Methylocucumis oryzae TaxID=1632867 RepID=UPI000A6352F5|nr:agmatine deiminase family protein [Methylocucumis oryzae]
MTRFPAEWESQSAVLIAWPNADGDFSRYLNDVEQAYCFIAQTIAEHQRLIIVAKDDEHQRHIQDIIDINANISYVHADINDIWVRDTVFLTVEEDGITQLCNFRFNGWGGKYAHDLDNALNQRLLTSPLFQGKAHQHYDFVLEGGSVESDGAGTVLTTKQCLLNPNRNPRYQQAEIEQLLLRTFRRNPCVMARPTKSKR